MKSVKLAVIAALSSFAVSAFALSPMQDSDLSAVSGQDGVTIGANLNIDMGSFVYTDTDATGGKVSFNNIQIRGAIAVEIDIINNTVAKGTLAAVGVAGTDSATTAFLPAGDVVRIALPDVAVTTAAAGLSKAVTVSGANRTSNNLFVGVQSITMGNSTKSFGAFAMNDIKMQGTTALIWAH
ncbi:MAG: hypothetical protein IPL16_13140 [Ignavibacteria bacterium]|jgi:hypothetical protein|nr:hypothetical protein [Ignavibacteria bacterium]